MGTGDILLFLGLGLHLAVVGVVLAWRPSEDEATLDDVVNICHELIGGLVVEETHACEGHSDFEKGFIRAEVIKYDDYIRYGSEAAVKEAGKLGVEGKEYVVQDGDIMHFRFNV